jgi:DNA-binding NarL/FixJ family response regulator
MTTVFIVAASDVVRAGLESLVAVDARFTVVGSAADLRELAAEEPERVSPDVVVFDAERQGEEAFAALRALIDEAGEGGDDAPAFVLIGAEQSGVLREALRAGIVRALLPSAASGGEIVAAVEAVAAGLVALDAETFAALLSPATSAVDAPLITPRTEEQLAPVEPELDALTPREREVLRDARRRTLE